MTQIDKNKRALLFGRTEGSIDRTEGSVDSTEGRVHKAPPPLRPPWALYESEFLDACTACGDCVRACPEQILEKGGGLYPQTNFQLGACTFCEKCVDACRYGAFASTDEQPWARVVQISEQCLGKNQIVCQSCGDACETEAIRFRPQLGGRIQIDIQNDLCNLCGACVGSCPVAAIEFKTLEDAA